MEKRSPLFYAGLFFFVIFGILLFSEGTLLTVFFVEDNSLTPIQEIGISSLGAIVFMVSYFLSTFGRPTTANFQNQIKLPSCLVTAVFFLWWMALLLGMLILSILYLLKKEVPNHLLFSVVLSYSFSGSSFAWISNRINAMKKP